MEYHIFKIYNKKWKGKFKINNIQVTQLYL